MYFCRHLTPECGWTPSRMAHPKGAQRIQRIEARAADAQAVARRLALVTNVEAEPAGDGWDLPLGNLRLHVAPDARAVQPVLSTQIGRASCRDRVCPYV